jgi:hypothetical protein
LKRSFEARAIHNAWVLNEEVEGLRAAQRNGGLKAFLATRLPQRWLETIFANRS